MKIVPLTLDDANAFVARFHRHSRRVPGHKFAIGLETDDGELIGAAIVGRPIARLVDDGRAIEILRVCTDGTPNANSMLYAACRRAARAMGHDPIITYTLPSEGGSSLRAAGFVLERTAGQASHKWHNRLRRWVQPVGDDLFGGKWRWLG